MAMLMQRIINKKYNLSFFICVKIYELRKIIMNYIKLDKSKCKACYLCMEVCPKNLIKKGSESNSLGAFPVEFEDKNGECIACAMCAIRCPHLAITEVVRSEK